MTASPQESPPTEERGVFVPAVMSVGLLFSIATLVRDAVRWTGGRARERRTAIEARMTASEVRGEGPPPHEDLGILSRGSYLITALTLLGGATYITIGSAANFLRDGGYVEDIAWLLAISLVLAAVLFFLAGVTLVVVTTWPNPPGWTIPPLRTAPLTATPGRAQQGPSWALTAATLSAAVATGMLVLFVGSGRSIVDEIDVPILDWIVEIDAIERLEVIDPYGGTIFSIILVSLIGLSAFRCRVMAVSYPLAFAVSWNITMLLRGIVDRARPSGAGAATSFPSGHMVQATFIAGLLPLALYVLLGDKRLATIGRVLLATLVMGTALIRIRNLNHWPLDALGGVALGLTVVLATHWIIEHRRWHAHCGSCPWSDHPSHVDWHAGVFRLSPARARVVRNLGITFALLAAAGLTIATLTIGLPADPEGDGLGAAIAAPIQIGFASLLALAALVAFRRTGIAASMMAIGAMMLGVSASIEYEPYLSMGLTALLLVPAVLLWFAWQPNETIERIATLAAVTLAIFTATGFGSTQVYDHYFGPTHPESVADPLDPDEPWLWLGGVRDDRATIIAGGLEQNAEANLHFWVQDPSHARSLSVAVDQYGLARFELEGLDSATTYSYILDDDASEHLDDDEVEEAIPFTTPSTGPQDLVIALGSCARSGSNGAVFDAIRSVDPDLYLALGDLHYANLSSNDPAAHISEYQRALRQPGQSALFRSTPSAYVWDDHDYGPNDADGSSVTRDAVSVAYRAAVPHQGVDADPDASIAQAFTIGRVRFVMTDTRSHRSSESMLGPDQLEWLLRELPSASATHAAVVWVNPTPWIVNDGSADNWSMYEAERSAIGQTIANAEIENLLMVSGDAHMLAIDDGTNSGYGVDGSGGFPVLHAAALDRPGSVKGGPYSEGTHEGGGQFGVLEIFDDGGDTIDLKLSGRNWRGEELLSWTTTFYVGP